MAGATYGDGRVFVIGDVNIWLNDYPSENIGIEFYDNKQLALNVFNWAVPPPPLVVAMRDLPSASVDPSETFDVHITADGFGAFGQVIETLPDEFAFVPGSATVVSGLAGISEAVDGQNITFTWLNSVGQTAIEFTYQVTAPGTPGGPFVFAGILHDQGGSEHSIGGDTAISVGWSPWGYDNNPTDGTINVVEVLTAISDYFGGQITILQVLQVISLYFSG